MVFQCPRWILHGVTESVVFLVGVAVPGGAHLPVWAVVGNAVSWEVRYSVVGSAEVVVASVFAAFAVGCAVVVVAEKERSRSLSRGQQFEFNEVK